MRRASHNFMLLSSQVALLFLVVALAWQGISAARTQENMVRGLMGDYALLIAENAERNFNSVLGYRTFYALLESLQAEPELFPMENPWAEDVFQRSQSLPVGADEILVVAARAAGGGAPAVLWHRERAGWEAGWRELLLFMRQRDREPAGFGVHHPILDGHAQTVLSVTLPGRDAEALIWFDPSVVLSRVESVLAEATLLPAVLGDPERLRPNINLALFDPAGQRVFSTAREPRGSLVRNRVIDGDYSGLLAGFEIRASINPDIAGELVIGGMPYDWLPLFLGLVAVTLLLGALTFFLTRRQREVQAMRDDFVARVSHELRTPLTQIRMYAESLLHDRIGEHAARQDALIVINRETLRLGHMVDSILRFESPAQNQPSPEPESFPLSEWGRSLEAGFRPLLDAEGACLELDIPDAAETRCNRDALTQIAGNLLDNSLKYGPRGQAIRVAWKNSEAGWKLEFRDQGPGIPPGRAEAIFEPYRRLQRESGNGSAGTGIGLGVAREIARSLGGDLYYQPDEQNGRFVLAMKEPARSGERKQDG
jgi:signal transduction histidine kinase